MQHLEDPSQLILKGPGDWKQWISIIEKFSINQDIWEYLNPDITKKSALVKPQEPQPSDINPEAENIA
jgi:hypothetical protein